MNVTMVRAYQERGMGVVDCRCGLCGDLITLHVERILLASPANPYRAVDEIKARILAEAARRHGACQPWPNPSPVVAK